MFQGRFSNLGRARGGALLPAGPVRTAVTPPQPGWRRLLRTLPGRLLLVALATKTLTLALGAPDRSAGLLPTLDGVANLALAVSLGYFAIRLGVRAKRRLLWRVRRKLILSYVFIGFVPALLIVAFFLLGGLLMFFNLSSYLFKTGFDDLKDEAQVLADTAAAEIAREGGPQGARAVLARKQANAVSRFPDLSMAVVSVPGRVERGAGAAPAQPILAGPWRHLDPPEVLPAWVSRGGFAGMLAYTPPDEPDRAQLVIRAAGLPEGPDPAFAVIVDLPVEDVVAERLRETTGIELQSISVAPIGGESVRPVTGRVRDTASTLVGGRISIETTKTKLPWVTFFDYTDWESGRTGSVGLSTRVSVGDIYDRVAGAQSRFRNVSLSDVFLIGLAFIGGLFLVIEVFALVMGFALAKSITGSVHELFTGTERVRQGDFTHRIQIRTRDQLGELADSFNDMTRSIEQLLLEADEKKRLAEELRIARQIQMSLLPSGPLLVPGVAITALCVPAREVGGDYYDFFRLSAHRLGILIADVSGKGTSAALYMAELKGLVLSLSEIYDSPKRLLVEANRIISDNLDNRSFITMTYAILDLQARTLTYARAGHTPLIYLPAPRAGNREAQVLVPEGMVLGLRLAGIEAKFEQLLEEHILAIDRDDVFVFYTDGVTEAMNAAADLFGESRLSRLIEEHGHLTVEELRERILREIEAFVGGADQHDDLTMILVKIEEVAASRTATLAESVAV
jgi:sigma-B regulation protein RsbU (phosphoserine phosphatase)